MNCYFSFTQAYPDVSDEEDHVDIENIEPYAAPGSLLNRTAQHTPLGKSQAGEMTKTKKVNPYDNVTDSPDDPDGERRYLNIEEMREHERMISCKCVFHVYIHIFHSSKYFRKFAKLRDFEYIFGGKKVSVH